MKENILLKSILRKNFIRSNVIQFCKQLLRELERGENNIP